MAYVQGSKQYGLAAAQSDIPPSWGSSSLPRPIPSSVQIVNLASQSGNQSAGGLIAFQVPTGAASGGYLKPNSMYLRGTCTVTGAGAAAVKFALPSASASSLINRMTCAIGGQIVSQINNYHLLHEMLLIHNTNSAYYTYDSNILEYTGATNPFNVAGAVGPNFNNLGANFCIPVINPLVTSDKAVPLFLLNAPIQMNFDLNNVANALRGAATDATNFTLSNVQLVYEVVQVDANYVNDVKSTLAAGNAYQLNLRDFFTLQTASVSGLNYQIGCNFSSVRGVLYTQYNQTPLVTLDTVMLPNAQTNFRVLMDGRLINNFALDTPAVQFAEMNRALSNLFDSTVTSTSTYTEYNSTKFLGGLSTNRCSDVMAMSGTNAQAINLIWDNGANWNAANIYIVLLYDQILTIDANGNVMLIK